MSDVEEPAADEGTVAEERRRRLEKLDRLAERGGSRYPPRFDRDHMVAAVRVLDPLSAMKNLPPSAPAQW